MGMYNPKHKAVIEKLDCGCQVVDTIAVPHCDCVAHGGRIENQNTSWSPTRTNGERGIEFASMC